MLMFVLVGFAESDADEWWKTMEINFRGVYNYLQYALPRLQKRTFNGLTYVQLLHSGAQKDQGYYHSHYIPRRPSPLAYGQRLFHLQVRCQPADRVRRCRYVSALLPILPTILNDSCVQRTRK